MGQGLDLAIQAERETAVSVSHQSDHYKMLKLIGRIFIRNRLSFNNGTTYTTQ